MAKRRARNTQARGGRKERIKAERRQFVLGLSMVAGLLLAVPWALAYDVPVTKCEKGSGICWDRLFDQGVPMLGRVGLGIGLGLAVGVALCLLMPGLKRSR